jgi:nucleoid-associated protein YgaU
MTNNHKHTYYYLPNIRSKQMRTPARLISVALLSLGLMAGCATTENTAPAANDAAATAQQAIDAAKAANKQAAAVGYEWRDTGAMIKEAEEALKSGDTDKATKLANEAKTQADDAIKQQAAAHQQYLDNLSPAERAALTGTAGTLDQGSKGAMAGKVSSYSVNRGDSLWKISGKDEVYANPYEWPLIYKTNRSQIKDADLIHPGQVFNIDQNASPEEVSAAIHHAKTRGAWSVGDVEQSDLDYLKK